MRSEHVRRGDHVAVAACGAAGFGEVQSAQLSDLSWGLAASIA